MVVCGRFLVLGIRGKGEDSGIYVLDRTDNRLVQRDFVPGRFNSVPVDCLRLCPDSHTLVVTGTFYGRVGAHVVCLSSGIIHRLHSLLEFPHRVSLNVFPRLVRGTHAYVQRHRVVHVFDLCTGRNMKSVAIEEACVKGLVSDGNELLVCSSQYAQCFDYTMQRFIY